MIPNFSENRINVMKNAALRVVRLKAALFDE